MSFSIKITRKYKLPDADFGDDSTTEIIDRVYDFLSKEEFVSMKKENNEIEFSGDKERWGKHNNPFRTDRVTHLIDKGVVRITSEENQRKLVYTFQIGKYIIWSIPGIILTPLIFGFISWSISVGLFFLWIILTIVVIYSTFLIIVHPATVSAPIEIMRYETIRKRNREQSSIRC